MPSSGVDEAERIIACRSRLGAPTIGHPTPAEGEGVLAAASPVPVGHLQPSSFAGEPQIIVLLCYKQIVIMIWSCACKRALS